MFFRETSYDGEIWASRIAKSYSPHHVSEHKGVIAWDVRDRVSYGEYIPLLGRWARRPDRRAARLARASPAELEAMKFM
jgi:hypothetical protein